MRPRREASRGSLGGSGALAAWLAGASMAVGLTSFGIVLLRVVGIVGITRRVFVAAVGLSAVAALVTIGAAAVLAVAAVPRGRVSRAGGLGVLATSITGCVLILGSSVTVGFGQLRIAAALLLIVIAAAFRPLGRVLDAAASRLEALIERRRQAFRDRGGARLTNRSAYLVGALTLAVVVNVFEFKGIDERTPHNYRAWEVYETIDVMAVGMSRQNAVRRYVGPFYLLGEIAPNAELIIPPEGIRTWFSFGEAARSFGRASAIRRAAHDYTRFVDLDLLAQFRIPLDELVPWSHSRQMLDARVAFYSGPDPVASFVVVAPDGAPGREGFFAFVDIVLLGADARAMVAP